MKLSLIIVLLFTSIMEVFPQNINRCGTAEYMRQQTKSNPQILLKRQELENNYLQFVNSSDQYRLSNTVITIPVVFHIIYSNPSQNISNAVIMSQLETINKDFSKTNSDTGSIPLAIKSVAANSNIQFCLAQQDPSGNATTGILRIPVASDPQDFFPTGISPLWSGNKYLNIYVYNMPSGILGIAQMPGAGEGAVSVTYYSVGGTSVPGSGPPYNLGRTLTHEIGHWLNLEHTFENGCSGTTANTCLTSGDNVCDTPPSNGNGGCPGFINTCTESSPFPPPYTSDMPDQWMNYMDYTDDACMFMFTSGQVSRMLATLTGVRSGLLTSTGCNPPSIAITIKTFVEGYYSGSGQQTPALINSGNGINPAQSDIVTIELRNPVSHAIAYTTSAVMKTNGEIPVLLPLNLNGSNLYIVIRGRNFVETWSKTPLLLSNNAYFNFSN